MPRTITLNPSEALDRLKQACTHDVLDRMWSEEEHETLAKIVGILDGHPRAIDAVANAIVLSSVRQVYTRLKHGLLCTILDPHEWGFAWHEFEASQQRVLCVAVCCEAGFDAEAITEISRIEAPEHMLNELAKQAWITPLDDGSGWHMGWSTRQLVMQYIDDIHTLRLAHAAHFLARFERQNAITSSFDEPNLEHVLAFGMSHDGDLAARAALVFYYMKRQCGDLKGLLLILESAIKRRPCSMGDLLGIELLARLGEVYRISKRFEESVEQLELALVFDPSADQPLFAGIHMALGLGLSYCGRMKEAREMLLIAENCYMKIGLASHIRKARNSLATIYTHEHNYEAASVLLSDLLEHDHSDDSTRSNLGAVSVALGRCEAGRYHLEHVLATYTDLKPRPELIVLNNLTSVDLCEDKPDLALAHFQRIEELYEIVGTKVQYRTLTLINRAFYAQRYESMFEAYHLSTEAIRTDEHNCLALAMRSAIASYQGNLNESQRDITRLKQPSCQSYFQSKELTQFATYAFEFGHAAHVGEMYRIEEVNSQLNALDRTTYSCMLKAFYHDLLERISMAQGTSSTLWVHPEGLHVRRGQHGELIDLRRSQVTRTLLLTLVEHRRKHPGEPCTMGQLFEATWPGQEWSLSAQTRLHTAIHRLRHRVLGELLVTYDDQGYFITAHCKIESLQ